MAMQFPMDCWEDKFEITVEAANDKADRGGETLKLPTIPTTKASKKRKKGKWKWKCLCQDNCTEDDIPFELALWCIAKGPCSHSSRGFVLSCAPSEGCSLRKGGKKHKLSFTPRQAMWCNGSGNAVAMTIVPYHLHPQRGGATGRGSAVARTTAIFHLPLAVWRYNYLMAMQFPMSSCLSFAPREGCNTTPRFLSSFLIVAQSFIIVLFF